MKYDWQKNVIGLGNSYSCIVGSDIEMRVCHQFIFNSNDELRWRVELVRYGSYSIRADSKTPHCLTLEQAKVRAINMMHSLHNILNTVVVNESKN